jgi:hypothetical protein
MKKISFLFIVAALACAACRQAQTSTTNSNIQSNSAANQPNSNVLVNSSTNILQNSDKPSQTNSGADPELIKQIEAQQLETADPRKAANKRTSTSNKQSNSPQRQNW